MKDEGALVNNLLLFLNMSLRGTNRGIGTKRGKGSLIVHAPCSPGKVPYKRLLCNYVIARRSRGNPPKGFLVIKSNISQLHNYSQLIKKRPNKKNAH